MQSKINNSLLALAYLIPVPIGILSNIPAVWYGEGTGGRLGAIAIVAFLRSDYCVASYAYLDVAVGKNYWVVLQQLFTAVA
jgi:hypothetical protein